MPRHRFAVIPEDTALGEGNADKDNSPDPHSWDFDDEPPKVCYIFSRNQNESEPNRLHNR
jgi:hypothetical protein